MQATQFKKIWIQTFLFVHTDVYVHMHLWKQIRKLCAMKSLQAMASCRQRIHSASTSVSLHLNEKQGSVETKHRIKVEKSAWIIFLNPNSIQRIPRYKHKATGVSLRAPLQAIQE